MPQRIPKACRKLRCPKTTVDRSGFCDQHKSVENGWRKREQELGNRHKRGYGSQWEKLRLQILKRDKGLCQEHLRQGIVKTGNHVDHIVGKAEGGTDEPDNLEVLCKPCHERKTAREANRRR